MQLKTDKQILLNALSKVARAVPSKAAQPILECFRILIEGKTMRIAATDGNITLVSYSEVEGEGSACIPAKMLLDIVRVLPSCDVTVTTNESTATLDWGFGTAEIPVYPAEDYPNIDDDPKGDPTVFINSRLKDALRHTLPHTSDDEIRPALQGVFFNSTDERNADLVASDSHTLSIYPTSFDVAKAEPFVLHGGAAMIVKDMLEDNEDTTMVYQDDNSISLLLSSRLLVRVRKVVGKFPDYTKIIPQQSQTTVCVDRRTFLAALQRMGVFTDRASKSIKLDITDSGILIEAQDLGFNVSAREKVQYDSLTGDTLTIGFRADLLIKTVGGFDGDTLTMQFNGARKAVLMQSDDDPSKTIVMPVMVK